MEKFRFAATFIGLTRDRGHGSVGVDANGEAVPMYAVNDELDIENLRSGIEVQVRLHEAAGAHTITALAAGAPTWRRGDDLEAFIAAAPADPLPGGRLQASSAPTRWAPAAWARIPQSSVADPRGELHDTKGVWIGDASAFPTSSGTNPMITIMALARRTADAIAEDAGAAAPPTGAASPPDQEVPVGN